MTDKATAIKWPVSGSTSATSAAINIASSAAAGNSNVPSSKTTKYSQTPSTQSDDNISCRSAASRSSPPLPIASKVSPSLDAATARELRTAVEALDAACTRGLHKFHEQSDAELTLRPSANGAAGENFPSVLKFTETQIVRLPQEISIISGTAMLIAQVIGSGIFISPQKVLERCNSIGATMIMWVGCAAVSFGGALCYTDLALLTGKSGGEYTYVLAGFGPLHKTWGPLPAFVQVYLQTIVMTPSSRAVQSLIISTYLLNFFYFHADKPAPAWMHQVLACVLVVTITVMNIAGVKFLGKFAKVFTFLKLGALGIIIACGIKVVLQGTQMPLPALFEEFEPHRTVSERISQYGLGFYSCMWAYAGYNLVSQTIEEVKRPHRTLPITVLSGLTVITIIYLATNAAFLVILGAPKLLKTESPAVNVGEMFLGPAAFIIPLSVTLSIFSSVTLGMFCSTRTSYTAARQGHVPAILSYVSVDFQTPLVSVLIDGIFSLIFVFLGDIFTLIDFLSFVSTLYDTLVFGCLLIVQHRLRKHEDVKCMSPRWMTALLMLISATMFVTPLISRPSPLYLVGIVFIGICICVYFPFVVYEKNIPGFEFAGCAHADRFSKTMEKFLRVVPETLPDHLYEVDVVKSIAMKRSISQTTILTRSTSVLCSASGEDVVVNTRQIESCSGMYPPSSALQYLS